jgi:NitT/TauT family transport system substrate-binding protein
MIAKRSSLVSVCLVVRPDLPIEWPEDLANRRIGVAWETGGHYMTLKLLDGFLRQVEISCIHAGRHRERLAALLAGEIDATHFHEPFATLAEKAGCRIVGEAMFRGGEVVNDEIDADTVRKLMRGLRRAVVAIDADPPTYRQKVLDLEMMPELTIDDVRWERVRYVDPTPYTRVEFERARDWMQSWGMIGDNVQYEQLVNPELAAAVAG